LQAGRLIAADCVNRPQEFMLSKKLITAGTAVDPLRLADESIAVQALMG
jgi:3-phenylpropionate/trans-cinnamate dioxygenase ferredoxin reductase subunit